MQTIKRIHVSQPAIRGNLKTGSRDPIFRIVTSKKTVQAHRIVVDGMSKMVYRPDKPLSCGARAWIETNARVKAFDQEDKLIEEID